MKPFNSLSPRLGLLGLLSTLLSGCLVTPVRDRSQFYALGIAHYPEKSQEEVQGQEDSPALKAEAIAVDFQVISLPNYLRKPQLMRQRSGHEMEFDEFHRWAEPVEEGIARIVRPQLRRAVAEAYRQTLADPVVADSGKGEGQESPILSQTLRVKLSLEELKLDLAQQRVVTRGEVSMGLKGKDRASRIRLTPECSYSFALDEKVDIASKQETAWEELVSALEKATEQLGQHLASFCSKYVRQNSL
ncbi:MAG: PqiC family protein [Puniceicoccales bacterium]|jgi:uncharacterized lipoprotein YmbA|nr:PqiC family protein [Puniceicoccales bacterium]